MKTFLFLLVSSCSLFAQLNIKNPFYVAGVLKSSAAPYDPTSDGAVVEWLKADALTGETNGVRFNTWTASIGNNATAAVNRYPIYRTNEKNGLPAVHFDNAAFDRYMTISTFGTIAQPFEVWFVGRFSAATGYYCAFDGTSAANRASFYSGGGAWVQYAGTAASTGTADTNYHTFRLVFNGASSSLTIDNGSPTTLSAGTDSFIGMTIGQFYNFSGAHDIYAGEYLVRNATTGDAAARWTYFKRWGTH